MSKNKRKTFTIKEANSIWEKTFGNVDVAPDFSGREIHKKDYGQAGSNSEYNWDIDHIYPHSLGGSDKHKNLLPCHITTNREKGDALDFYANNRHFKITIVKTGIGMIEPIPEKNQKTNNLQPALIQDNGTKKFKYFVLYMNNLKVKSSKEIIDFLDLNFKDVQKSYVNREDYLNNILYKVKLEYEKESEIYKLAEYKSHVLNTYFRNVFLPKGYLDSYKIYLALNDIENKNQIKCESFTTHNDSLNNFAEIDRINYIKLIDSIPDFRY